MQPDIIVVGAGPAGSTTACYLARAGVKTLLLDKCAFPRDKTCGDGLSPRAQHALGEMGLLDAVAREAHDAPRIVFHAPNRIGTASDVRGPSTPADHTLGCHVVASTTSSNSTHSPPGRNLWSATYAVVNWRGATPTTIGR